MCFEKKRDFGGVKTCGLRASLSTFSCRFTNLGLSNLIKLCTHVVIQPDQVFLAMAVLECVKGVLVSYSAIITLILLVHFTIELILIVAMIYCGSILVAGFVVICLECSAELLPSGTRRIDRRSVLST